MAKCEVKDVVCDYGVYEDGELKLICNSRRNALLIKDIMKTDSSVPNTATIYDENCFAKFLNKYLADGVVDRFLKKIKGE